MAISIFKKQTKKPNQIEQFGKAVGGQVAVMIAASAVLTLIDTGVSFASQKVNDLRAKRAAAKAEEAAPTAA